METYGARPFRDRQEAGRVVADRLGAYKDQENVLVLALPRGGVPVGFEVARELRARLDVFLVRKLGVPGHEELAMGAIAAGGVRVLNREVIGSLGIPPSMIEQAARIEEREMHRQTRAYRGGRPARVAAGQRVILVDDGLATGATMRAAVESVRDQGAERMIVAVPVGAPESCAELQALADEVVCAITPAPFRAVGEWYEDFAQTTDEEVCTLLQRAEHEWQVRPAHPAPSRKIFGRR